MLLLRVLFGLTALFVAGGVGFGVDAYFTYQTLQKPTPPLSAPEVKIESVAKKEAAGEKDFSVIARRNLFTSTPLRPPPPQIAPKPVSKVRKSPAPPKRRAEHKTPPKKPLNLRLVGTTVGSEGIRFAIIEDSTSKAQTIHREGDRIQGAVLQKVDRGEILLVRDGRNHVFRVFQEDKGEKNKRGRDPQKLEARIDPARPSPRIPGGPGPGKVLSRKLIESFVAKETDLFQQFRAIPYRNDKGDLGVRIFPTRRGGLLDLLGVRGGDIVFEVGENPVQSREEFGDALLALLENNEAEMVILRRGKKEILSFQIQ